MVISLPKARASRRGSLLIELLAAMTIIIGVLVPLAWSLSSERRLARSLYQRAIVMAIVDGELELLLAGEWKSHPMGTYPYPVRGLAVTNLPRGSFSLTLATNLVRLEWRPEVKHHGGGVVREARLP